MNSVQKSKNLGILQIFTPSESTFGYFKEDRYQLYLLPDFSDFSPTASIFRPG
tara:strand:- start:130 stop:288 length:159 start_codon:yes stop_codon:yes gene_type:complete